MLHILNLWLMVGMLNISSLNIPITNIPDNNSNKSSVNIKPNFVPCLSDEIQNNLASLFGVPTENVGVSEDMYYFFIHNLNGFYTKGQLFYSDCGEACSIAYYRTFDTGDSGYFTITCDIPKTTPTGGGGNQVSTANGGKPTR